VLLSVAAAHAPATPAQVTLAWLWAQGVPSNPRSMSPAHMAENLAALGAVTLTPAEMSALSSRPIDYCAADNSFYECVPAGGYLPGAHPLLARRA
jgi:diketogulonate reductase-like aldo/keto reductase